MNGNLKAIEEKFKIIKNKGWVKSQRSGTTGIGYTLEKLFEIEENNLEIPDFSIFELKSHRSYPRSYITLFNATPDGDFLFEIDHLKSKYGYPDAMLKQYKVLNFDAFANRINNLGSKYKQILKIEKNERKVRLYIMNNSLSLIDKEVSWSFEMLKEKFERKLKYLVYVKANKKTINNIEYFKYDEIIFYKSYSFDKFIELLNKGIIKITFKIGVFKSGKRIGQTHDHGTGFSIPEKDLELLYEKVTY